VLVLVLVLVLERNVWFWCVRGRVAQASRRHKESRGPCPSASRLAHDRLTHPTGLLLLFDAPVSQCFFWSPSTMSWSARTSTIKSSRSGSEATIIPEEPHEVGLIPQHPSPWWLGSRWLRAVVSATNSLSPLLVALLAARDLVSGAAVLWPSGCLAAAVSGGQRHLQSG
jgi:hypothetical protein